MADGLLELSDALERRCESSLELAAGREGLLGLLGLGTCRCPVRLAALACSLGRLDKMEPTLPQRHTQFIRFSRRLF